MANWVRETSAWLPIDSLATGFKGSVVLADETLTVQWFSEKPSKAAVTHREHERDGAHFLYDDADGEPQPRMKESKVKPAFWALARIVD